MKLSRSLVLLLGAATVLTAVSADAAGRWGKPGLWQMTTTMNMGMAMPKLTAAQIAQMKKYGIKPPTGGDQSIDVKMCVTPKDVENFDTKRLAANQRSGCTQTSVTRVGNRIATTVTCDGTMKGTGKADVTLIDDTHYSTMFVFKGVSHNRPVNMKVSSTAHWLGANCGRVKPFPHG